MNSRKAIAQFFLALSLIAGCKSVVAQEWKPVLSDDSNAQPPKWDWQLKVPVRLNNDPSIEIYDIDMFDNESTGAVGLLKSFGKKVICYVNVGSWEDFRDDKDDFPSSILGNVYYGFPDEKWLDIRDVNPAKSTTGAALARILESRFDRAEQMGCDAVEPDNMDVYDETAHDPSGFPLTYEDQMYFNLWVSKEVRERGMAVGLKNNINQALDPRTIEAFDFVVSEQCVQYNECSFFTGFIEAGKPVFLAEYELEPEAFCPVAKEYRISATGKREQLDTYRENCDAYYSSEQLPNPDPVIVLDNQANNLLFNGSFESALNGWQSCGNISNLSTSVETTNGTQALLIEGGPGCLYQEVAVQTGDEHRLVCQAQRTGDLWTTLELSYLDGQYNKLSTQIKQIPPSNDYRSYTLTGLASENSIFTSVLIYSEDRTLVDNCVLTKIEEPETPPEPEFLCNGKQVTVNLANGDVPTSGDDVILGTRGDDTIFAMGGNDTICSLAGKDTVYGGRGSDWIDAGPGSDNVEGGNDDDTIFGDSGIDTLNGGPGNDDISGGENGDYINGNSGNDTLSGGDGVDQILGGPGNDIISTGNGGNRGTGLYVNGGSGNDTITGGDNDDEIRGATGNDIINGNNGDDALYGGGGNDIINGQDGDDLIRGNGSKDTLDGGKGEDNIDGGDDNDTISGGYDNDTIRGATGNDVLHGGPGDDNINGGGGDDRINGNLGNDTLSGGGSNDILDGGEGLDSCDGQTGNDSAAGCEVTFNIP